MRPLLIIACGALAREVKWVLAANRLDDVDLTCLPADLHNTPDRIPGAMAAKIDANRERYARIVALYGDCGTGGALDAVLAARGVERIPGPHCYAFYAGEAAFEALQADDIGSFYLTDYLVRFFDRLIVRGLGLDRHPELRSVYFGNYTRLVYLAQTDDPGLDQDARAAAERLDLAYVRHVTGYGGIGDFILRNTSRTAVDGAGDDRILA